jgi:hypothetical protein
MVVRADHSLARTALGTGPTRVELEPWLIKRGAVGPDGRVCRDGLRPDLLLTGLDPYRPRSNLDVRIPYPDAPGYLGMSVTRLLETHEAEKVTQYKTACETHQQQSGEFVPFVATTDGVLGGGAQKVLSQLVERLCTKWEHKSNLGRDHGVGPRAHRRRHRAGDEHVHPRPAPQARPRRRGGWLWRRRCPGAAAQRGVASCVAQ